MWESFISSFEKAVSLIFHPSEMLTEIVWTTLRMAFQSTFFASLAGIALGCLLAYKDFKGKRVIVTLVRTFMGLPPVAVGIVLYLLFSGTGPFGGLGLIYSVELMVIAQVILITPITAGMTENALTPISEKTRETFMGLNINFFKRIRLLLAEGRKQLICTVLFAFARSTAEVGAVQIVGGNILHSTRVMTTAIMMNYNTGSFELAMALSIILILIALSVNACATVISGLKHD